MDIKSLYQLFLECTAVSTDSRNCPPGSLFFALKGENFNGNAFAAKALESGSAYAVIDEAAYAVPGDERYIVVDHSLRALQLLARHHRRTLGTPIIGITGTNGKTTTKELIAAVLTRRFNVLYTRGNLNNQIGVPLTLLHLRKEHQLAVVEMGASHPGDIRELVEIAEPDYGLITNVGKAHLLGFGSFEGVVRTKGELYDFLRTREGATIFLHDDNPFLKKMAEGLKAVRYGSSKGLDISGATTGHSACLAFTWQAGNEDGKIHEVRTQLIGAYNLPNALAAVCIGHHFGIPSEEIDHALEAYTPQNNRSQLKQTGSNTLIIDAYNANPTSMRAAIDNFRQMQAEHKLLILGDMGELGAESEAEHRAIAEHLRECGFKEVIFVGRHFADVCPDYPHYPDAPALIAALQREPLQGRTILLKGSNYIRLGSVVEYL